MPVTGRFAPEAAAARKHDLRRALEESVKPPAGRDSALIEQTKPPSSCISSQGHVVEHPRAKRKDRW